MNELDGKTLDVTSKTIDSLKRECPEVFTDGKVDFEKLKLVLGENIETSDEKYEFKWNGKNDAIKLAQMPSMGTLRPDKDSSKNWDNTENLYIEGDNLEVLKLLQKSYFGKIKMIYIDPPYNTGKDFVYKDNFKDNISNYKEITNQKNKSNSEISGRYHTDWLNMMYPRLKLARNLLSDDGVIFISIDDNEVFNLKKVCDEVFGEDNFIGNMLRKTVSHIRKTSDSEIQNINDCILFYSKNKNNIVLSKKLTGEKEYPYVDENGKYLLKAFQNSGENGTREARPNLFYPIYYNESSGLLSLEPAQGSIEILPKKVKNKDGRWLWSKDKFNKDNNILTVHKGTIYKKEYEYEVEDKGKYEAYKNWLDEYPNKNGSISLRTLNLDSMFSYPKPVELIEFLIELSNNKNAIILDFFSGSCTTAHAVMQFNAKDNGSRKFIMVQLPEQTDEKSEAYKSGYKNICEIGKERIRRAGEKIVSETGKTDLDIGFKVFKLDDSNLKTWNPDYNELEKTLLDFEDNLKEDRTQEDLLYEVLLKLGYELTSDIDEIKINNKTIFKIENSLLVCLENDIDNEIVEHITKINTNTKELKIVFKESGFKSDKDKMNAAENLKQFGITNISFI